MKYLYLCLILLSSGIRFSFAQIQLPVQCGIYRQSKDDFEIKDSIKVSFDTTNIHNLWMIGRPQKPVLDSAWSPVNVLITDTINPCKANDTSYATVTIPNVWNSFLYFKFLHKYDIDSVHQRAFLECSYDTGATWLDMNFAQNGYPDAVWRNWMDNDNVDFNMNEVLNEKPSLYGTTNNWQVSGYYWQWYMPVRTDMGKIEGSFPPQTVLVRFVFINDSVAVNNDGWMIDDMEVYYIEPCGGVNEPPVNISAIYPNPVSDVLYITSISNTTEINISDALGRSIIAQKIAPSNSSISLNTSQLVPGIYFLSLPGSAIENRIFIKE